MAQPSLRQPLPAGLVDRHIDQVCDRFETAWKEGKSPRVETYLAEAGDGQRSMLLRELVLLETAALSGVRARRPAARSRNFRRASPSWMGRGSPQRSSWKRLTPGGRKPGRATRRSGRRRLPPGNSCRN